DAPRRWGFLVLTICGLAAIGAGIGLVRQLRRVADPMRHPAALRVGSWGDLAALSSALERDVAEADVRRGAKAFGESYFVVDAWASFDVRRWEDLLWVYAQRLRKSVGGIPAGSTWSAVAHFRDAKCEFFGLENDARAFVARAATQAPWAVEGWTEEAAADFANRPTVFRAAVRKRREAHQAGSGPSDASPPRRPSGGRSHPRRSG